MDEWIKIMEEEIIPFQVSKGMVICGSFRNEENDETYTWMRRFESEAQREALYKAVYETDYWKNDMGPRVPNYLDRANIVVPASSQRQNPRCADANSSNEKGPLR